MKFVDLDSAVVKEFSRHFTAWTRVEPRCRRDDFSRGLQARIADPLWSLGRQWQTAEFEAEDAGSPVHMKVRYATQRRPDEPIEAPPMPLEVQVEREHLGLTWRDRVQIGQRFEQLLRDATKDESAVMAYRDYKEQDACVFRLAAPGTEQGWAQIDRPTRRFLKLAHGRVIDGAAVLARMELEGLPLIGGLTPSQLEEVAKGLRTWCLALGIQPSPQRSAAWRNPQLDYRFDYELAVAPNNPSAQPAPLKFVAPEYRNGDLDWHTFNLTGTVPQDWKFADSAPMMPSRASVGGTSSRWWAFEDAAIDFGNINVSRPDLARLFLMEYVLVHGDDWYVVPLSVQMPCAVCVERVFVMNVFGEWIHALPARNGKADPMRRFDLFGLSRASDSTKAGLHDPKEASASVGDKSLLLIPPMAGHRQESPALEEVRFLRDEGANKVWAVEHVVRNGIGRSMDGFDGQGEQVQRLRELRLSELEALLRAARTKLKDTRLGDAERKRLNDECKAFDEVITEFRDGSKPSGSDLPRYRLSTTVSNNWFPFAPFRAKTATGEQRVVLRRAQMLGNTSDKQASLIPAMTRLLDLEEDSVMWLEEASVTRSGVSVQLTGQRVRWNDGMTYVWKGRKVLIGKGEGRSGLTFDVVMNRTE